MNNHLPVSKDKKANATKSSVNPIVIFLKKIKGFNIKRVRTNEKPSKLTPDISSMKEMQDQLKIILRKYSCV